MLKAYLIHLNANINAVYVDLIELRTNHLHTSIKASIWAGPGVCLERVGGSVRIVDVLDEARMQYGLR